ncbi:MAG: cupin domain-containing protein, partial [Acidobacteria bacterium]|nr:cupin domain-containing protein [Acidobacteriota bacterium]
EQLADGYRRKMVQGENLSVARLEAARGSTTRRHKHRHEEMIILLKGSWLFRMPTGEVTLQPNQMLTIPAGTEHSSEVLEDVVAIDVCSPAREDWVYGEDRGLRYDPEQSLWGV